MKYVAIFRGVIFQGASRLFLGVVVMLTFIFLPLRGDILETVKSSNNFGATGEVSELPSRGAFINFHGWVADLAAVDALESAGERRINGFLGDFPLGAGRRTGSE